MKAVFIPQTMGIFILLIIILGFFAGELRKELALSLSAAFFSILWLYCLLMTLILALIQHGRAGRLSARIRQREISAGEQADVFFTETGADGEQVLHNAPGTPGRFRMPGILIRSRLLLKTSDGRHIKHDFDFLTAAPHHKFTANERGAFFSDYDEYAIFDILGFFRFAYRIPCEAGYRLLVCPHPAIEAPVPAVSTGGTERPAEFQLRRTDNLIDHRPYIPGDDPRRINWKLFGHGNELFVREGENQPPPGSNVLILIDTHYDPLLYSAEAGRQGVDLLCENALACALELMNNGLDVNIGYTGLLETAGAFAESPKTVFLHGSSPPEIAAIFARPAAISRSGAELPVPPADLGIVIFALPRANAEESALNRFLNKTASENKTRSVELIFLYEGSGRSGDMDDAAGVCTAFYNRRPGVRARLIKAGA